MSQRGLARTWQILRRSGLAALLLAGCSKSASLNPLEKSVDEASLPTKSVHVQFCTDPAKIEKQYLKTIVILDHSGSNQQNYQMAGDGSGQPVINGGTVAIGPQYATDPTGSLRYGSVTTPNSLLNYLSSVPANNPADPTRFFALIDFNSTATTYPANSAGFTSDTAAFFQHVQQDATAGGGKPNDNDATSYLSALNAAYNIMQADIQNAQNCAARAVGSASPGAWCPQPGVKVASSYVVVFVTDGSPITKIDGLGQSGNQVVVTGEVKFTIEKTTDILAKVNSLVSLADNTKFVNSVNLFTVYYYKEGNVDLNGQQLLAKMAKVGNGMAYDALSGSSIDYTQFQPPAKLLKYSLNDVIVTNSSVTWWTDGQLHLDSDMDGLPDDVETAWGTDPLLASTAGNGVSDFVRYQLSQGAACTRKNALGICTDAQPNYASGLCASIPHPMVAGKLTFRSSDPNGLNDCEKLLLNDAGGVGLADSNTDFLPDWLEFKNSISFQLGTKPALNVPDQSGYTVYQKIKYSLPMSTPVATAPKVNPSHYAMTLVSSDDTQDCYSLDVTGLPQIGDHNTIRVDVLESSPLQQNDVLYRVARKAFGDETTLEIKDWTDVTEQAAKTWSLSP